jgi:protein-L-isoaspartate O-methyltransferase
MNQLRLFSVALHSYIPRVLSVSKRGSNKTPERLIWAVDQLDIEPSDHVLEIGCGTGVAASLVCEKLESGKLLAIDRSVAAIRAARKQNREHIRAGRAEFAATSLRAAKLDGRRFHKIFAFNVGSLRKDTSGELGLLLQALRPDGQLCLFEQPPSAAKTGSVAEQLLQALYNNGFRPRDVVFHELKPAPVVCLIASLARVAH